VCGTFEWLVGTAEADEVRSHGTKAPADQAGDHVTVQVRPGRLAVEEEHRVGARCPLVDVVDPDPARQAGVPGLEGEAGELGEAVFGGAHQLHGERV
jgi:hypothetical protein